MTNADKPVGLVGAAQEAVDYLRTLHNKPVAATLAKKLRAALAQHVEGEHPDAKRWACGCVPCVCAGDDRCYGCGAKSCGDLRSTIHVNSLRDAKLAVAQTAGSAWKETEGKCATCGAGISVQHSGEVVLTSELMRRPPEPGIESAGGEADRKPFAFAAVGERGGKLFWSKHEAEECYMGDGTKVTPLGKLGGGGGR